PWDVNFVWKYDNYGLPHDELGPEHATPRVREFIRDFVRRRGLGHEVVVEKTVSNALRVPFVRAVFPDARFIHLIRDGRAVSESARGMWQAPADVDSVIEKLRVFPLAALPRYATSYALSYAARRIGREGRTSSWGPRFRDIDGALSTSSLLEVCGEQWR